MAGTTNGAAKRPRRKDGTFERAPLRERMRNLSVEKKRAMRFLPTTPKAIALAQHEQPEQLPPNRGQPLVLPAWTFSGIISSYSPSFRNPDEAVRHSKENARNMRNDCSIMECVESRQRAVELLNWHIAPEDDTDARQVKACETLTRLMKKTPNFKKYRHAMLEAIWYGRYAVNQRWQWCFDEGKKRAIIGGWTPLNGDKLVFGYDDGTGKYDPDRIGIKINLATYPFEDEEDRLNAQPTIDGYAYFPPPWKRPCLAVHKHIIEDAAFEDPFAAGSLHGVGVRSRIYWTWFQMQEALAMLIEFLERVGLGITIYYYPAGDEAARGAVEEIAKNQRQNNYLLVPRVNGDPSLDAYGVERVEPNAGGAQVLQDAIVMLFAHRIKRYILGQTLTTESDGAGLGSSGISDLHKWGFFQIIKSDAIDLEETMTREVLKNLVDFNLPEASQWDLRFVIDTEAPDVQGQLEGMEKAFNMGLEIVEDDVRDMLGLSKPDGNQKVLSMAGMSGGSNALMGAGIGGNLAGQPVGTSSGGKFGEKIDGGGDDPAKAKEEKERSMAGQRPK